MEQLVEDVLAGKKGAASRFYYKLVPAVRNYIRGRVGNERDVEELTQDTFMSALDSLSLYRGEASIKTFVISIARHEVADWYRKRYVRQAVEKTAPIFESMMAEMGTPEWVMKKKKLEKQFMAAYHTLSMSHQDVLSYRYELGMSVKEIAKRMELSLKATESLLYRARVAFRLAYEPSYAKATEGQGKLDERN